MGRIKGIACSALAAVALGGPAALIMAGPASAEPRDCTTSATGTGGFTTYRITVRSNPCGFPMRAYITCGNGVKYGPSVTAVGATSSFACNVWLGGITGPGGWQTYTAGTWVTHEIG